MFTYLTAENLPLRLPITSSSNEELVPLDSGELAEAAYQVIGKQGVISLT